MDAPPLASRLPLMAHNGSATSVSRLPLSGVTRTKAQQRKVALKQVLPARADLYDGCDKTTFRGLLTTLPQGLRVPPHDTMRNGV